MSDFNYNGKLPFHVISSSVNTGYNAELTSAVGNNIEIVDLHTDQYGGLQDAPLQGPFTERWVGGNQHRHIELNDGTDNVNNRPEAFIVSGSQNKIRIYGPDVNGLNSPRAVLTRDNIAKSPLNIKNIRGTDKTIGNFTENYEIVQNVGRRLNNNLISDGFIASSSLKSKFVKDIRVINHTFSEVSETQSLTGSLAVDWFTDALDYFGVSTAINSQGNILAIGALNDESGSNGLTSGVAYIFTLGPSGYVETARLTGSLTFEVNDNFGNNVSLNSQGNIVAVSSYGDAAGSNGVSSGVVYIFSSGSSGYVEIARLTGSLATDMNDRFGISVSLNAQGDIVAVGAFQDEGTGNGTNSGVAYVFTSGSNGYVETAKLTGSLAIQAFDFFGNSVSLNSQGNILAVGAYGDEKNSNGDMSGVAYIFSSGSSGYVETAILTGSLATNATDRFGVSVSLNSQGNILAIGSQNDESGSNGTSSGVVYVFSSGSNGYIETAKLTGSLATGSGDNFGFSVSLNSSGDVLAVGAYNDKSGSNGDSSGVAYVFTSGSSGYVEAKRLTGSLAFDSGDNFGFSVCLNSEGNILVAGAYNDKKDINQISSGVTYVFKKPDQEIIDINYALPDIIRIDAEGNEYKNKTTFVQRFSAPGGKEESSRGALDREGEEFAPNNSLVTRNIKARQPLYSQLTQPATQFNSNSTIHGVNRNSLNNIELSGNTVVSGTRNDNFWVQHSIPSTDLGYKWINDSVLETDIIEYQNLYKSDEIIFNSASLVTSGSNTSFQVDNNGLNSIIKNKKSIDLTTNTFNVSSSASISASYSEIANSAYQYAPWKQLRTGEHPVARKLRENNIVSVEGDRNTFSSNGTQSSTRRPNNVDNFIEPPVTSKNKPLRQILQLKNTDQKFNFTFTHTNNLSDFPTDRLNEILNYRPKAQQIYDLIRKYYSKTNRLIDNQNPITDLIKITHSETLYPREINTYLAKTRGRTRYILDQAGFDRDGYDRQLGTQRVFWRDNIEDRKRTITGFYNSLNYLIDYKYSEGFIQNTAFEQDKYLNKTNNNSVTDQLKIYYTSSIETSYEPTKAIYSIKPFDNQISEQRQYLHHLEFYYNFDTISPHYYLDANQEQIHFHGPNRILTNVISNGCTGELNHETFLDYFYYFEPAVYDYNEIPRQSQYDLPYIRTPLVRATDNSILTQFNNKTGSEYDYSSLSTRVDLIPKPRPNFTAFLGGFESGSRDYSVGDPTDVGEYSVYSNKPAADKPILSTLDSGLRYDTESFGNKKPWFDSYEDYSDDIRVIGKEHSILPEFRISNHIPYYIKDSGGNFRVTNRTFLENDGSGIAYRTSNSQLGTVNQEFVNSYVITEPSTDARDVRNENYNLTKLDSIKFTISGIKKLLPYNGFYPQERTLQLANLFNDYMDQNIGGGYFKLNLSGESPADMQIIVNVSQSYADLFAKNTIMPYFFAPGILYNTIKSGISVDFPLITASYSQFSEINAIPGDSIEGTSLIVDVGITKSKFNVTGSFLYSGINSRMPFESIIFPKIPVKQNVDSMDIYWDATGTDLENLFNQTVSDTILNIKFDCLQDPDKFYITNERKLGKTFKNTIPFAYKKSETTADPSYSMAMSNFLAEIPRFFLKNSSMNVFRSLDISKWKPFEIGKKYYLDIKMKKTPDLVMIESYKSNYHITGSSQIEKTMNGRYFGWPVNKLKPGVSRTENANYVIHNDPAYAPFTPPYFEGEAILRLELSASKTNYNSVDDLRNDTKIIDIFPTISGVISTDSLAYKNKMSIDSCMEVFGSSINPMPEFDAQGNPVRIIGSTDTATQYWCISPKLETPVLDFSDQQKIQHTGSYWLSSGYGRGMWSGYGKIPQDNKGITIELVESFPLQTNFNINRINSLKTGSLLQQVGFSSESKKIGQIADKKQISEAIVAIPYVDTPIEGKTVYIDGYNFFAIDPVKFNAQKTQLELNTLTNENSITRMMRLMKKYVLPPNFDFSTYYRNPLQQTIRDNRGAGVDPFVMYIFEFTHDLDQQDLADIWQGVMPKIATTAEKEEISFGHKIGENELFGADFDIPSNMRWMVFKVKKKAEWNYFAVTENIGDDDRFKFNFANSQVAQTPDYSYNWPYDYFSLVELAKVDVSYNFTKRDEQLTGSMTINVPGVTGNQFDLTVRSRENQTVAQDETSPVAERFTGARLFPSRRGRTPRPRRIKI
jgi:hypothetical protein